MIWGIVLLIATLFASPSAEANEPSNVKARPRIAGDKVPSLKVEDIVGNTKSFDELTRDKYVMIAFVPAESLDQENIRAYFQTIRLYIERLGYEIFVIATMPTEKQRSFLYQLKPKNFYIDRTRSAFVAMGLSDAKGDDLSVMGGVFFVNPKGKILSQFSSSDNHIPFSGDALVLSARVAKQIDEKKTDLGERAGPTVALELREATVGTVLVPTALTAEAERQPKPVEPGYVTPDESVLRLLTTDDAGHPNSLWMQAGFGLTPYDARRDTWSPRWSPGFQFGRRFNTVGAFINIALDQTFDLTQEVKRLDVIHVGFGVETVALYGRVRSSIAGGAAILNSDTDIDSRGKIGWYLDFRPIGFRWIGSRYGVFEITPLGLNISVPVTRGIPLILVGYMTTLSFELGMPVPK